MTCSTSRPNGSTVVAWSADHKPTRVIEGAVLPARGVWERPVTLENGTGVRMAELVPGRGSTAVCLWRDSSASETRIRVATFDRGRWSPVETVASTLDRLRAPSVTGAHATRIRWQIWYPTRRLAFFEARRSGSIWLKPSGPTYVRRYVGLVERPGPRKPRGRLAAVSVGHARG